MPNAIDSDRRRRAQAFPVTLRRSPSWASLEGRRPGLWREGKKMGAFVYMLRCADQSFYIGIATGDDLTKRIAEHQSGAYQGYTSARRPVILVWFDHFPQITDAIAVERKLKGWTRAKKEALIKGDWGTIRQLSKRRGGQPPRKVPS